MSSFENYIPKLVPGSFHVQGQKIVFESDDHNLQVILPIHCKDIAERIDGQSSIKQIIEHIYKDSHAVGFKTLFNCIHKLSEAGALTNESEVEFKLEHEKSIYEKRLPIISKPLFAATLVKKLAVAKKLKAIYYLLAASILIIAGGYLIYFEKPTFPNAFLKINDSYLFGLAAFFVLNSVMITMKTLYKTFMLILSTGRAYHLSFQINWFSISLRINDNSIYSSSKKLTGILYCLASISCHFFTQAWLHFSLGESALTETAFFVAFILTLVDLDPFRKSDATRLFNMFYTEDHFNQLLPYLKKRSLLAITAPKTKIKDEILFVSYSTVAILWLLWVLEFSTDIFSQTLPNLHLAIAGGPIAEKASAAMVGASILVVAGYIFKDIVSIVFNNLIFPISHVFHKFYRSMKSNSINKNELPQIVEKIRTLPLFENCSNSFINQLFNKSEMKIFKKGTRILIQGMHGNEMYILVKGSAEIWLTEPSGRERKVARLDHPVTFGEIALINHCTRTASVVATEDCHCLIVSQKMFNTISSDLDMEKVRNKIKISQALASSPLFQEVPGEALKIFVDHGTLQTCENETEIIKQGTESDDFYLVVRGAVDVVRDGKFMQTISQGGFFGEIALIANMNRTATVKARGNVQLLKIDRSMFWKVISDNINLAIFIESVAELRMHNDNINYSESHKTA